LELARPAQNQPSDEIALPEPCRHLWVTHSDINIDREHDAASSFFERFSR
jgi:hypothetical protein